MATKLDTTKTSAPSGVYLIHWYCEHLQFDNFDEPIISVLVNGSVVGEINPELRDDRWHAFSGFVQYTHTSGDINVRIDISSTGEGDVAIRRARVYLTKVGD